MPRNLMKLKESDLLSNKGLEKNLSWIKFNNMYLFVKTISSSFYQILFNKIIIDFSHQILIAKVIYLN